MGLLDDLMAPLRDIANVKKELTQEYTEVKETLIDTKGQLSKPIEVPIDAPEEPKSTQNDESTKS